MIRGRAQSLTQSPLPKLRLLPLLLLLVAATIFWQCEEKTTSPVYTPEAPLQFIDSVSPTNGAVDVPVHTCIRITFLRPMDTASLAAKRFHFTGDHIYSISRDSMKVVICAAGGLNHAAEYEVVIDSGLVDTAGNVMTVPYSFSFRTESGNALVTSVSPTNGQTDVPLDRRLTVTFSGEMDTATLNAGTVLMSDGIEGAISYADRRLTFTPTDSLESYHTYTMTLKASIADTAGTALGQDYTWSFTTVKSTSFYVISASPVDGAVQVPVTTNISVYLSQAVDRASVTADEFTVDGGVPCSLIVGVAMITLNPSGNLQPATRYTARFTGSISNLSGQAAYINRSWSFTTADTLPPQVVSVSPADGAVGVPINTALTITFNKTLASASFTSEEFRVKERYSERDRITVSGNTVTLDPYYELLYSRPYTAAFDGDISDQNGHTGHIDYTWTFTTFAAFNVSSHYPASEEGCIPLDAVIHMEFSHVLDSTTITPANIVIEEDNGPRLSGVFSCRDSIVEFQPDEPLTPLKTYKATLLTGIKDVSGVSLPYQQSWRFSAKGANLLPLAIGNKWIYQTDTAVDSIALVGDTIISGKRYYVDQNGRTYRGENDTLEFSMSGFPLFGNPHVFVNSDCVNRSVTVTTNNGTFLCQRFHGQFLLGPVVTQQFDFAPGVGLVHFFEDYWSGGSGDPHQLRTWTLLSYELRQ